MCAARRPRNRRRGLEWHPNGPIVLAGCEDFCAWMWNASDGNLMQVFAGIRGRFQDNFRKMGRLFYGIVRTVVFSVESGEG